MRSPCAAFDTVSTETLALGSVPHSSILRNNCIESPSLCQWRFSMNPSPRQPSLSSARIRSRGRFSHLSLYLFIFLLFTRIAPLRSPCSCCVSVGLSYRICGAVPGARENKHANSSDRRRMSMLTHSLAKFQPTTLGALPILSAPAYRDLPASRVCKPLPCSTASLSLCFARQPLSVHA